MSEECPKCGRTAELTFATDEDLVVAFLECPHCNAELVKREKKVWTDWEELD